MTRLSARKLLTCGALLTLALPAGAGAFGDAAFLGAADAVHQAVRASFAAAAQARVEDQQEEDSLLALLASPDAAVRAQAARELKAYAPFSDTARQKLLDVLQDRSELASVRREAARALSAGAADENVRGALLELAQRPSEPDALRAMCYKALYWQAADFSDVREALLDAARSESDRTVRLAAIWALFCSAGDADVRDALIGIAKDDGDTEARVEALKSLWGEMGLPEVRELARGYAQDASASQDLRVGGALMLSRRFEESDTELLSGLAQNDSDAVVRQAAVLALGGPDSDAVIGYFHSFHYVWRNGIRYIVGDPLDKE